MPPVRPIRRFTSELTDGFEDEVRAFAGGVFAFSYVKLNFFRSRIFPFALSVAIPNSILTALFRHWFGTSSDEDAEVASTWLDMVMDNAVVYRGFSFLLGFLIVFRTSQATNRFKEGTQCIYQMHGAWMEAASTIISFSNHNHETTNDWNAVHCYRHTAARLLSLLNALCLAELAVEEANINKRAMAFQLLDYEGIDTASLDMLTQVRQKPELVFHWLQVMLVHAQELQICTIPPPLLSRTFHQLGLGMSEFHAAKKIACVPFPLPYTQATELILIMHWLLTPILVSQWSKHWVWAMVWSFVSVFMVWALNTIAMELENPFDEDGDDDLNLNHLQQHLNRNLVTLVLNEANQFPCMVSCPQLLGHDHRIDGEVAKLIFEHEHHEAETAEAGAEGADVGGLSGPHENDLLHGSSTLARLEARAKELEEKALNSFFPGQKRKEMKHISDVQCRWLCSFDDVGKDVQPLSPEELIARRRKTYTMAKRHVSSVILEDGVLTNDGAKASGSSSTAAAKSEGSAAPAPSTSAGPEPSPSLGNTGAGGLEEALTSQPSLVAEPFHESKPHCLTEPFGHSQEEETDLTMADDRISRPNGMQPAERNPNPATREESTDKEACCSI